MARTKTTAITRRARRHREAGRLRLLGTEISQKDNPEFSGREKPRQNFRAEMAPQALFCRVLVVVVDTIRADDDPGGTLEQVCHRASLRAAAWRGSASSETA